MLWEVKLPFSFAGGDLALLKGSWCVNGDADVKKPLAFVHSGLIA